jgi:YfiH family protein
MPESTPAVAPAFYWKRTAAGRVLVCAPLEQLAPHVFTTRDLTLLPPVVDADYARIGAAFSLPGRAVMRVRQVHGRDVLVLRPGSELHDTPDADAVVSDDAGRVLAVRTADCIPMLVGDRKGRAVAAIHAGWRGTASGVARATVDAMGALGVPPEDLVVAIGPGIGACCYQVDTTVHAAMCANHHRAPMWFTADGPGHWRLELWRANRDQLEDAGVPAAAIHCARLCTKDNDSDWYSFRREGEGGGRMVAAIRLKREPDRQIRT